MRPTTYRIGMVEKTRATLEERLSNAQRDVPPQQTIRVSIYHGSEPLKKREDESARDFTQRKVF